MNQDLQKRMLLEEYKAYAAELQAQGRTFSPIPDEELDAADLHTLATLVKKVKDLARTPI